MRSLLVNLIFAAGALHAADTEFNLPADPGQSLERTCFQTSQSYSGSANLRSDVALVYGIDKGLPDRIQTWRDRGYRIHVMTGVSWGNYQDYLYGRFDGKNHEDEAQTDRRGNKISHGGDVYYMCPGENYGKFLAVGVQRALDAGAEAIHLEEPEFWVRGGYSEGFKREWRDYYHEDWQPPHSSADASWRAAKLKYYLYRRALQQVFDHVRDYNRASGRKVRCYVPTHSLINYAHWHIVSPESSLARLEGCDGYIAQVWTGTSRTPNMYQGRLRERTFETAFLEYGAMQNLVRSTGRTVWYLNDPIEDNPNHDWNDYQRNWESTLVASLLQPEVWRFEVAPWPERIFKGRYPRRAKPEDRKPIPAPYATELQTVMNALNDMNQSEVKWDAGSNGIGVLVSDSLMFERGDPTPSDPNLSHFYGLAMPLVKRGMPVALVQLENVTVPRYLDGFRVLLATYHGMKPLGPEVHQPLVQWVKKGGVLVFCDDDSDPYNSVRDWWNTNGNHYATPREHLFEQLGFKGKSAGELSAGSLVKLGRGGVIWLRENPSKLAGAADGDTQLAGVVRKAADKAGVKWRETNYLLLQRGPYTIAAGMDESTTQEARTLRGRYVNLFDAELRIQPEVKLAPGTRYFLLNLDKIKNHTARVLASAGKALTVESKRDSMELGVEGIENTPGIILLQSPRKPSAVTLAGTAINDFEYSPEAGLLWVRFPNEAAPRKLHITF